MKSGIIYELEYDTNGIPLKEFEDKKENIQTSLGVWVDKVDYKSDNNTRVVITCVKAIDGIPSLIPWDDKFLSYSTSEAVIGWGLTDIVTLSLKEKPHWLLAGTTGSGKTILLKNILYQFIKTGADVCVADMKNGVDFPDSWRKKTKCAFYLDEIIILIDYVYNEMNSRMKLLSESGCRNIDQYNERYNDSIPRVIFACDEVASITSTTGVDKITKEKIEHIRSRLMELASKARAANVNLILSTQYPSVDILGSGAIKSNFEGRICGHADQTLSQLVLNTTDSSKMINKNDPPGRFIMNDTLFQGFYFDKDNF